MKKQLRKLTSNQLTRLAHEVGVALPNQSEKEQIDAIAEWAQSYNLRWTDFIARFPWVGMAVSISLKGL